MSEAPSPALLLAAIQRAETQRTQRIPGAALATLLAHLDISRRAGQARQIRAQLDSLTERGALDRRRIRRIDTWTLTLNGRRRLANARRAGVNLALPPSPQHRRWRNARTFAEAEIDRFRNQLREALKEAEALLDAEPPTSSETWLATGRKLQRAAWLVASAIHCLREWHEPPDDRPDTPDPHRPLALRDIQTPP